MSTRLTYNPPMLLKVSGVISTAVSLIGTIVLYHAAMAYLLANTYHAWGVAVVNGKEHFFDPTAELNASSKASTYTTERYY